MGGREFGVPGEVWRLECGDALVCEVVVDEREDFHLRGRLRPGPAFADGAPLFESEAGAGDDLVRERVMDEINRRFTLRGPAGPVGVFSFLVRGDRAGFRWAD